MSENRILLKPLINTNTGIFCHLLQIDKTKIIIDCGIGPELDYSIYDSIKDVIESAECIILTSFDLYHMGAVGLFKEMEIFCTIPTAVLGRIVLDEVHSYFREKVLNFFIPKQIKYSQPFKVKDLEIISYNAGYSMGNCIFKITKDLESISVGYDLNHRKEHFLDGIEHSSIENTTVLLTNTKYVSIPVHSLKNRDEKIIELVDNSEGSVIFAVSYSRLFELLCILNSYKVSIVSKNGKMFVERVKSMIEWAGSKSHEIISQLDVQFVKITDLKNQKIIVLINEFHFEGYLGTVLQMFNSKENTLVLIDHSKNDINFGCLKVFEYTYRQKEIIETIDMIDLKDEDNNLEIEHWSMYSNVFFVTKPLDYKDYFPHIKRRRQSNEYGEVVNFKFEKKTEETNLKLPKIDEVEEIEEKVLHKTGVIPELRIVDVNLYGCSDFTSFKTVCESSNCKSVIFVDDNKLNAEFSLCHFKASRLNMPTYLAREPVMINYNVKAQKITVSDKVMELKSKNLFDKSVTHFKASRKNEILDCVGECPSVILGRIELERLRKSLIEDGFQVETQEYILLVNNQLWIEFLENGLNVKSKEIDLMVAVKKTIYKHLVVV